jgi:hypothetical protein
MSLNWWEETDGDGYVILKLKFTERGKLYTVTLSGPSKVSV